jgi:hypothetical protein
MMNQRMASAIVLAAFPLCAAAFGPSDYIYLPGVTYGEHEIDFKSGAWKQKSGENPLSASSIGYGYGVTQRWFTELYSKYERPAGETTHFDAWEWENKFQLTETGEYPVDTGLIVELERPKDRGEGYEFRFGPLFQTEIGKVQLNGNLLFERHYRADAAPPMQFGYQWQVKYRWQPKLELGFQGFGELGQWNHWDSAEERSHRIGPAIFGKLALGNRQAIRYNAAWLVGASTSAPSHNLRLQVEYEF